jgi:hypothetical protein
MHVTGTGLRERSLPAQWSVLRGRDSYLQENGFPLAGYDAKYAEYPLPFGLTLPVPNSPRRRWAVRLHDLHHVATGFGTDKAGEGEISAWELRRGVRALGLYVGAIVIGGTLLGMLVAPRRTLRAWRLSRGTSDNLFHGTQPYEQLLTLSIADLRRSLGVPDEGLSDRPRALHAHAPVTQASTDA